jgi:ribosomal protein L37AE/L43A
MTRTDHPQAYAGPPCPVCESDTVRAKDEDGRRVWRCPSKCQPNDDTETQ